MNDFNLDKGVGTGASLMAWTFSRSGLIPSAEMMQARKESFGLQKGAFVKLNSEAIHVQSAQDCLEDVVMGCNHSREDEDVIDVGGNTLDSLQSPLNAALESGVRTCQSMGHADVVA